MLKIQRASRHRVHTPSTITTAAAAARVIGGDRPKMAVRSRQHLVDHGKGAHVAQLQSKHSVAAAVSVAMSKRSFETRVSALTTVV